MKKLQKIVFVLITSILLLPANFIVKAQTTYDTGTKDIYLQSTNEMASSNDLYVVDGMNRYAGYKMLKGYPNEDKF